MTAPLASLDQLAAWLGVPQDGLDVARAAMILDVASGVICAEAGQGWDGVPVPDQIVGVTLSVAARVYRNPTGATDQTVGPFRTSGGDVGGIVLTSAEKAIIHAAVGSPSSLWTQQLTRHADCDDTIYVDVVGGSPFPLDPLP